MEPVVHPQLLSPYGEVVTVTELVVVESVELVTVVGSGIVVLVVIVLLVVLVDDEVMVETVVIEVDDVDSVVVVVVGASVGANTMSL